ncbi:hypothetical protein ACFX2B_041152 [Malus domestica]
MADRVMGQDPGGRQLGLEGGTVLGLVLGVDMALGQATGLGVVELKAAAMGLGVVELMVAAMGLGVVMEIQEVKVVVEVEVEEETSTADKILAESLGFHEPQRPVCSVYYDNHIITI